MPDYIRVYVSETDYFLVELAPQSGWRQAGGAPLKMTAEEAAAKLNGLIQGFARILYQGATAIEGIVPDKFSLEFGVSFGAETNGLAAAILTKATGEANIKVSMTWKKPPKAGESPDDTR